MNRAVICLPTMPHRHALYDYRRLTDGHWLVTASMAKHAVLDTCMSLTEALCLSVAIIDKVSDFEFDGLVHEYNH